MKSSAGVAIVTRFFIFYVFLPILLLTIFFSNYSSAVDDGLNNYPASIDFTIYSDQIPAQVERKLYLWTDENVTGIDAQFTELSTEEGLIIPSKIFHLQPADFDLSGPGIKQIELTITANLDTNYPQGTYKGRVKFASGNVVSSDIEISIKIVDRSFTASPSQILFTFDEDKVASDFRQFDITTKEPVKNISGDFTNLWTEDGKGAKIDRSWLTLDPTTFDINNTRGQTIRVKFEPTEERYSPGTYKGSLILSSGNIRTSVPISVVVNPVEIRTDVLKSNPDSILFTFDEDKVASDFRQFDITTKEPVKQIAWNINDLQSADGSGKRINNTRFSLNGSQYNITRGEVLSSKLLFDPTGDHYAPGTYKGSLILSSGNIRTSVPISVVVNPVEPKLGTRYEPIIFTVIGMAGGVLIALIQEGSRVGKSVLQAAEKAIDSFNESMTQMRRSKAEFSQGYLHFKTGFHKFVLEKDDATAIKEFEKAQSLFAKMTNQGTQVLAAIPAEMEDLNIKVKHSLNLSLLTFRDMSFYVIIGIVFIIAVLTVLQGMSKDILEFKYYWPSAIQAILYGFGSQAIANMIVPYFKK